MLVKNKYILIVILFLVILFAGVGAGYFFGFKAEQTILNKKLGVIKPIRENNPDYKFTNPLLLYLIPSSDQQANLSALKNKITDLINNEKSNGLSDASVYFSDLNHGRWIGVNQDDQYNPASMLKVVVAAAYYKQSENNPDILNKYLFYSSNIDSFVRENQFNTLSSLQVGNNYSVNDLISKMIIDSDNGAEYLLLNNINQTSLDTIYAELNIGSPEKVGGNYTISPRNYSFFFRILYSATYLSSENSEKVLSILSKTTFNEGLVAGVPTGTAVAHKYGEYVVAQNGQPQQIELHDCGIIYYPKNPYLLCIMTKGTNLDNLKNTIKNISGIVYQNYSSLK